MLKNKNHQKQRYCIWTQAEEKRLKQLYSHHSNAEISNLLGRSKSAITIKAYKLGLKKIRRKNQWSIKDEALLKHEYPKRSVKDLAKILKRSPQAIYKRALQLGLHRPIHIVNNTWSAKDDAVLRREYTKRSGKELAKILNRTYGAIRTRAYNLGINKPNKSRRKTVS